MMNIFFKTATIIVALGLFIPVNALADGMVVPPYDYMVYETDQKAVIFYEEGVETLILSITFEGDAENFGWLVPTPSKPEVAKSSDELFTSLQDITAQNYIYEEGLPIFGGRTAKTQDEGVSVIETQKIDYYEATTLQASDTGALSDWLDENNYNYPASASGLLSDYVKNNWYFVALKIDTTGLTSQVEQELKTGHATPVEIKFSTDKIIYPLKISGAISYFNEEIEDDAIGAATQSRYRSGKTGQSISLGKNDILTTSLENNFNSQSGTIAFWVKDVDFSDEGLYHEFINIVDQSSQNIIELRLSGNIIEFITTPYAGYPIPLDEDNREVMPYTNEMSWQAVITDMITTSDWHLIAVTWTEGQAPVIYFDGEPLTTQANKSGTTLDVGGINSTASGTIYLGQSASYPGEYSLTGLMDELVFFQAPLTAEQIAKSYQQGSYELYDSLLWSASFENNLTYTRLDGTNNTFSYERRSNITDSYNLPSQVSLLLYVITDSKQTLPGFDIPYAGWLTQKEVRELAYDDQLQPWIEPAQRKYFLTKFTRTMAISEMKNDIIFRQADDNNVINAPELSGSRTTGFNLVMLTGSFLTAGLMVVIVYFLRKKEKPLIKSQKNK